MSNRGLAAATITALGEANVEFYHLVEIGIAPTFRYTTAPFDIVHNLQTFDSSQILDGVPTIVESIDIKPSTVSLKLSGVIAGIHSYFLGTPNKNLPVTIYMKEMSTGNVTQVFGGYIDSYGSIEDIERGTSFIDFKIANHWANWEQKKGRLLTQEYQQFIAGYAADFGLEYAAITPPRIEWWGDYSAWVYSLAYNASIDPRFSNPYIEGSSSYTIYERLYDTYATSVDIDGSWMPKLPVFYGQATIEGIPVFRAMSNANQHLWVVYALAEGECDSLVDATFDGRSYTDAEIAPNILLNFHSGTPTQAADADLNGDVDVTAWTSLHRLQGICYVAIRYTYNANVWANGEPIPVFTLKGKKLYDPRTTLTTWSKNPALVLYDYLLSATYGKDLISSDLSNVNAAADYCETQMEEHDDSITGGGATYINLLEFNGALKLTNTIKKNVEQILFCMRGHLSWVNGQYKFIIRRHDDTGTFNITDDNLTGTFKLTESGIKTLLNQVTYDLVDGDAGYIKGQEIETSATFLALDNDRVLNKSIINENETNRYRAKNRAATEMKASREVITVDVSLSNMDALQVEIGDIVNVTRSVQGWVNKKFRVIEMRITPKGDISMKLKEYEATVFDWAVNVETDPPLNTQLTDPYFVAPITGLTLTSGTTELLLQDDGTIVSRIKANWTPPTDDPFAKEYVIYVQDTIGGEPKEYTILPDISTSELYIAPVSDGETYTVSIVAVNAFGVPSAAVSDTIVVVGKTAPPSDMTGFSGVLSEGRILLTWNAITDLDRSEYEIREGADWATGTTIAKTKTLSHLHVHEATGDHVFHAKALDTTENESVNSVTDTVSVALPADALDFSVVFDEGGVAFEWSRVSASGGYPIKEYEIRKGTVWSSATPVIITASNTHYIDAVAVGTHDYLIKALDIYGNESVNAVQDSVTVNAPSLPVVTLTYDGVNVIIGYGESTSSYLIDHYEIRKGASWAAGTTIAAIKTTSFAHVVDYLSESFFVRAVDIHGNESTEGGAVSTIVPPSVSGLSVEVIDNNVLLRWSHSLGTLPIKAYEIRRGAVFATADVLQEINGTFAAFFENVSGEYTYWVVGIDTAGNYGTEQSVVANVNEPPDYVLNVNFPSTFNGTHTNSFVSSEGNLVAPVDTAETWQQHFVNNSWTTPQDQITAGYPIYIEPSETSGSYVETYDFGAVLDATLITVVMNSVDIDGSVTVTPNIKISPDNIDWSEDLGDVWSAYGTSFRYVRVTLTFASAGGDDIIEIQGLNFVLNSKIKNDMGSDSVSVASTGKVVSFNKSFVDIESIVVTPNTTSAVHAVVDFTDTANPTDFTVYLYNSSGVKVTGDFMWTARGY